MPLDEDGHGTHVTGTIAERTGNDFGLTGLASRAKIIPVRVLDSEGFGTARNIAKGIRLAANHKAQVINMSFEFSLGVNSCGKIKGICSAIKYAFKKGALVVAAAGNENGEPVAYPAGAPHVIGVGPDHQGRLPGERVPHRGRPRPGRAGRRLPAARELRDRRRPVQPRRADLPAHLHRQRLHHLRLSRRLRGHLDGRRPRLGRRRAGDREPASSAARRRRSSASSRRPPATAILSSASRMTRACSAPG